MKVQTVDDLKDGFLVTVNGDYHLPFSEVVFTADTDLKAGTVLESATAVVSATSTQVLGILAEDMKSGESKLVRVMVRGNPSTVDAQKLVTGDAVQVDVIEMLGAKGIVVVNA